MTSYGVRIHDSLPIGIPESNLLRDHCAVLPPRLGHVLLDWLHRQGYIELHEEAVVVPEANPFAALAGAPAKVETVRWYLPGKGAQLQHLIVDELALMRPAGVLIL